MDPSRLPRNCRLKRFAFLSAVYAGLVWVASREAPLELDDPNSPVTRLPLPGPTIRSGLHFILPVVVLVWALMIDRLSPGLSAFRATAYMVFILLTQRPLITVHLFVFYFGIMADVTPPVGLASFAAAAISGGDPIKTGVIAFFYSLRTAALPFLFIFNTELLLINVGWGQGIFVFVIATIAMLFFAAATQGWFLARSRICESAVLLLVAFTLFRPGFRMDMIFPPCAEQAPTAIIEAAADTAAGSELRLRVAGVNDLGDPISFVAILPIGEGADGAAKLEAAGLAFREDGDKMMIDDVAFGSPAANAGLGWDQEVLRVLKPVDVPSKYLMFIPALLLLALIVMLQRARLPARREPTPA